MIDHDHTVPAITLCDICKQYPCQCFEPHGPALCSGWQCPSCGSVYSPAVLKCWTCGPKIDTTTSTKLGD